MAPARGAVAQGTPKDFFSRHDEAPRRQRRVSLKEFSSTALHHRFEEHIRKAQDAFLIGDTGTAETHASKALAIRPTAHLFAFMAVLAESKGQFDRASDFRLLQAFLAKDRVLWEELLHEFLSQQLYFKSAMVLQRLSALEKHDRERYRTLQMQLADLYIGLGEIRRAVNVLVPLWESSRCQDFGVFSTLSGLYFQLGKWNALEGLISSSLRYFLAVEDLHPTSAERKKESDAEMQGGPLSSSEAVQEAEEDELASSSGSSPGRGKTTKKRIRFLNSAEEEEDEANQMAHSVTGFGMQDSSDGATSAFSSSFTSTNYYTLSSSLSSLLGIKEGSVGGGEQPVLSPIHLQTPKKRQSFLILINVHSEFLNEQSKFMDTIQLVDFAAACLGEPLLSLPPDLLFRYGTACAFQGKGSPYETPCIQVFQHLLHTCRMNDYGDVLLDAAANLCKAGMIELSEEIYDVFVRYYSLERDHKEKEWKRKKKALDERQGKRVPTAPAPTVVKREKGTLDASAEEEEEEEEEWALLHGEPHPKTDGAEASALSSRTSVVEALKEVDELEKECKDLQLILSEAFYGLALCRSAREDVCDLEEPARFARKAIEVYPSHLQARLLLGKHFFYDEENLLAAVEVLTPRPDEPALQRIQLGALLVSIFRTSKKYVEAIALGVSIFNLVLHTPEDGDTESVAPGSYAASTRRSVLLKLPTLSRASSAIVPASSLSAMLHGPSTASTAGGGASFLSASLASSIRAGSTVFRQQLRRRGHSALTTTVYGTSAAQSLAAGWDRKMEEEKLKDSSTLFQFNRKRPRGQKKKREGEEKGGKAEEEDDDRLHTDEKKDEEASSAREVHRRRVEVMHLPASSFWSDHSDADAEELPHHTTGEAVGQDEEEKKDTSVEEKPTTDGPHTGGDAKEEGNLVPAPPIPEESEKKGTRKRKRGDESQKRTQKGGKKKAEGEGTTTPACGNPLESSKCSTRMPNEGDDEDGLDSQWQSSEGVQQEEQEVAMVDDALPSLEEVSKQFEDKEMAQLFLAATMGAWDGLHPGLEGGEGNVGVTLEKKGEGEEAIKEEWRRGRADGSREAGDTAFGAFPGAVSLATVQSLEIRAHLQKRAEEEAAQQQAEGSVSAKEVVQVLGRHACMELARNIMECYRASGWYSEAKEFAALVLARFSGKRHSPHHRHSLERPLRLALLRASLAAGEGEDAFRVGVRLLQDETSEEEREEVLQLLHGVLNRAEDRSPLLFRYIFEGNDAPALVLLLANRYFQTRSYCRALNLYLAVYSKRPHDVLVVFMIGLLYFLCSHQKQVKKSEACVTAGIYFFSQYQDRMLALLPQHQRSRFGEVVYNTARVLQLLQQPTLCIPMYERVGYHLRVPEECTLPVQRAARFNLYFLYRWRSDNAALAIQSLMKGPSPYRTTSRIK